VRRRDDERDKGYEERWEGGRRTGGCPVSVKLSVATCKDDNCTEIKVGQVVSMMLSSP
jgi:hypothetical protein